MLTSSGNLCCVFAACVLLTSFVCLTYASPGLDTDCVHALFAVRKPSIGNPPPPPQIVHPPHLYTNTAATVIQHPGAGGNGAYPIHHHSPDTATYVNVVSPASMQQPPTRPPFYHHPPPMLQQRPPHPGSGGHVPYSPAFQHHQHVRPVGIAMPRQGNNNVEYQSRPIGKSYHARCNNMKIKSIISLQSQQILASFRQTFARPSHPPCSLIRWPVALA